MEERTRDLVLQYLKFDPALDNGEPTDDSVLVSVFYPPAAQNPPPDEQGGVGAPPRP